MKRFQKHAVAALGLLAVMLIAVNALSFEVITREDIITNLVPRDYFVKTADNFIVMFDASSSMDKPSGMEDGRSKYEVARDLLKNANERMPDLGFYGGLYLFAPSVKEIQPVAYYQRDTFLQAIDSLPDKPSGPTRMVDGLKLLEETLAGMAGKTAVFIFTDGTYTATAKATTQPEDYITRIAKRHDVCFYFISDAADAKAAKWLAEMSAVNACSRVISFDRFVRNPHYMTGALYLVKSTVDVETSTEKQIVGLRSENVLFEHNKTEVRPPFHTSLDAVGDFLVEHPKAFAVLAGYADNTGSDEINIDISMRRSLAAAEYLMSKFNLSDDRLILLWYGTGNPVASNADETGRALNRRVEISIGSL